MPNSRPELRREKMKKSREQSIDVISLNPPAYDDPPAYDEMSVS